MAYGTVKSQLTRRAALFAGGAAVGAYAGVKLGSNVPSVIATSSIQPKGATGTLNDASLLSETPVAKHIVLPDNPSGRMIEKVRNEINEARETGRPFNIGAARHSMGAHSIPRDGTALTYDNGLVEPDTEKMVYRVHAGARWSDVIAQLDRIGMSPKVMQSNNDFGVAATFCVNAHGWPVPWGPMGESVRQVYMLRPDSELLRVSRDEFAELFTLTMGGYGLTGAILELEVEMVPNVRLKPTFQKMPSREFAPFFVGAIEAGDVNMAYGRLNVDREGFFEEALMITYRETKEQEDLPPATGSGFMSKAAARIFRAQLMNETIKDVRWGFEASLVPYVAAGDVTRNTLLNEPVITLDDRDPTRTDILHEYFVPPEKFPDFIDACQQVIPASYQELLNITLRYVKADRESVLAYAPGNRIACVMLFSQEMTQRAETDHKRMTQDLIERVLDMGGTYYLPYRPHATGAQLVRGYPRVQEFIERKLELDPTRTFRNGFWDTYLADLA